MNINKYQNFLLITFFCTTGCVNSTESLLGHDTVEYKINLTPNYVDDDYRLLDNVSDPRDIVLDIPIIPGALLGSAITIPIIKQKMTVGESTEINLSLYESKIKQNATPFLSTQYNSGIMITPKETQVARLATFARDLNTGEFFGETGIRDLNSNNQIQTFIVYFDRVSNISGMTKEANYNVDYDIEVKNDGFT